jgi:hypothetical protein
MGILPASRLQARRFESPTRSPQGLRFSAKNKAPSRGCYFFGGRVLFMGILPASRLQARRFESPTRSPQGLRFSPKNKAPLRSFDFFWRREGDSNPR